MKRIPSDEAVLRLLGKLDETTAEDLESANRPEARFLASLPNWISSNLMEPALKRPDTD